MSTKILIADDEMGVKTLFKHFMEQYPSPYTEYKMVSTGEELRNTCLQEAFDIVFSDIKMPGLTGLEAIYEIKNASKNDTTSYYIISGYEEFEFAQQAIRLGIKDYILKPVRYSVVEEILRNEEEKLFLGLSLEDAWAMHDKEAAYSQGVTHFVGRTLRQMDLHDTEIATSGYKALMTIVDQTCNDPLQLFYDLQHYNPYAREMRLSLQVATEKVLNKLRESEEGLLS